MRRPFGALAAVGLAVGAIPAGEAIRPAAPADALIDQLASPSFAAREAAAKGLLALGPAAQDVLDKNAAYHPDPEVRQRAADVAARLRKLAESASLAPATAVALDYAGVPLAHALADLRKKTGVPLTLDPDAVGNPLRPVTVKTGELPAWQAVDEFLRAAGLVEVFRDELPVANAGANIPAIGGGFRVAAPRPAPARAPVPDHAVLVRDGTPVALPGDWSSGVRVVALPPAFRGNRVVRGTGQVVLNLDVTPLPGLKWGEATTVRVHRAEDETGRPVTASHRVEEPAAPHGTYSEVALWGGGPGQVVFLNEGMSYVGQPTTRPNPRIVPVALKTDDRAVRSLRVFEGVVVGEVTVPNQPLIALSDLPKAVGRSADGPQGARVTLLDYQSEPGGRAVLRLRVENPNPWTTMRLGRRQALMLQNDLMFAVSGPAVQHRFTDATGNVLRPQTRNSSTTDDGVRQTLEAELVFPARPEIGPPAHLTVTGNKQVAVEIPFKMRNVPLP